MGYTHGYEWDYSETDNKSHDYVNSGHLMKHVLIVAGIMGALIATFIAMQFVSKYAKRYEEQPSSRYGKYSKLSTQ